MENLRSQVVKDYLGRFPNAKSLTLAKKIHKETGLVFDNPEQVRGTIRTYRGTHGKYTREKVQDRRFYRTEAVKSLNNDFDLPESEALDYPIFTIPAAQNEILILSDIHVPYHDVDALTQALAWGRDHEINTVFLNGDFWDFHALSNFVKDPRKRNFQQERETGWLVLDKIREVFPDAVIYFKAGNHEDRLETYLKIKAPELFDTEEFRLDIILKLGERGISFIGDKIRVKAGKLNILHGHEYKGGTNSVNPARWLFLKSKGNALCGHFHQVSEHTENNINGEIIGCYSVGCLSELHPEYMPLNKWSHGFARVRVGKDGEFKVTNLKVYNGRIL